MEELVEEVARLLPLGKLAEAVCAEKCAQMGEPPCSSVCSEPHCHECQGIAMRMHETFLPILARERAEGRAQGIEEAAKVVEQRAITQRALGKPEDWPEGSWNARQVGIVNALEHLANAISDLNA